MKGSPVRSCTEPGFEPNSFLWTYSVCIPALVLSAFSFEVNRFESVSQKTASGRLSCYFGIWRNLICNHGRIPVQ